MTFPDGTRAIDEVSFSRRPREFVTIVGPSGCGKSTLLRIASGLLAADRRPGGHRPRPPRLRVPGRHPAAVAHRAPERRAARRAARRRQGRNAAGWPRTAIDMVGLTGFEGHYPKSLSGGMRMRCSLARTLTLQPAGVPVRRAVRRRRRDHPRAPQRADPGAVPGRGLRRAVHHPLDQRGGVHEHPGARDVAAPGPHRRRVRRAVRLPPLARAALRARLRPAQRRHLQGAAGGRRDGRARRSARRRGDRRRPRAATVGFTPPTRRRRVGWPVVGPPAARARRRPHRRLVLHLLRRAGAAPPVPAAAAARGPRRTASSTGTTSPRSSTASGRAPGWPCIGLAISIVLGHRDRRADEPDQARRAGACSRTW